VITGRLHLELLSTRLERRSITLSLPAQRLKVLSPEEGRLLIDYGTVHSCVRLLLEGKGQLDVGLISLEEEPDEDPFQLKSSYRVRRWLSPPHLEFGAQTWAQIPNFISQTDFAAKLRLGTGQRRSLRDRAGVLKMVSGEEAAAHLLREILERVAQKSGYRARALWFTRPAAFSPEADEALLQAALRLGHSPEEVELRCAEPEAYLCALASERSFLKKLDLLLAKRRDERPLLGFVFDFGGGTCDLTLFQVQRQRMRSLEIISSHGYHWLGGESITIQIAGLLFQQLPDPERFPFPEICRDQRLQLEHLDRNDEILLANFAELRQAAEHLKCSSDWNALITLSLLDFEAQRHTLEINIEAGNKTQGIYGLVYGMISRAMEDLLERIIRMSSFGVLQQPVPQVVAVAGNSGKLWCLEQIMRAKLKEAGAQEILYHFDPAMAKTGVVEGLAVYRRHASRVGIQIREADPHWWYIRVGVYYHLIQTPGAKHPHSLSSEGLRPALEEPVQLWGSVELFQGPGPEEELDASSGRNLNRTHRVELPELQGRLVELAMGFDPEGQPGLWLKPLTLEGEEEWQWQIAQPLKIHRA